MKYAFLLIFMAGLLNAGDLPPSAQVESMTNWSGGLYTDAPANKIKKNFTPNSRNVFVHRNEGQLIKRGGFAFLGSTNTLRSGAYGFTFYKEDGSKEYIVSDSSIALSTRDYNTYVLVSSGMNFNFNLDCTQAIQKVWCTNGSDPVFTWDGTNKQILDGTKNFPNVPRFKYIDFFLERIFGLNTSADGMSLNWSAVTVSTTGQIISPDHHLAWPEINESRVGEGDGEVGTALWVYRGQLQIGKQRSIYTLFGDRDSNFLPRKTISHAGVSSNDSVVVMDNLTYYKGPDGIYAYDGSESVRISDFISPDVEAMQDPSVQTIRNTWETQSQFAAGQFSGSTATVDGFVTISTITSFAVNYASGIESGTGYIEFSSTDTQFSQWAVIVPTEPVNPSFLGAIRHVNLLSRFAITPGFPTGDNQLLEIHVRNTRTGEFGRLEGQCDPVSCLSFQPIQFFAIQPNSAGGAGFPLFTGDDFLNSRLQIQVSTGMNLSAGAMFQFFPATMTGAADIFLTPATTAQYISEVTTATTVTAWDSLGAISNPNGGNVAFFYHASTSIVNIATKTWNPITPGALISEPTINRFIQWAATISSIRANQTQASNIDLVTIDHIEGAASTNRAFATDWKNEYWLTVSTELTGNFKLQYVKSRITNENPHAWNVLQGINIGSIFKDGSSVLYGGSSSTGAFYRLDYGTNDDGRAIVAFYETPDLLLRGEEGNWMEKKLYELWVDVEAESGNTFKLGTSVDGGAFTEKEIDLSGMGRILHIDKTPNKFGRYFRFRFKNDQVDKDLGLNNFAIVNTPQRSR